MATEAEIREIKQGLTPYSNEESDLDEVLLGSIIDRSKSIRRNHFAQYGLLATATLFPLTVSILNAVIENFASDEASAKSSSISLHTVSTVTAALGVLSGALKLYSHTSMKERLEASIGTLMHNFPLENRAAAETFLLKSLGVNGIINSNGVKLSEVKETAEDSKEKESDVDEESQRMSLSRHGSLFGSRKGRESVRVNIEYEEEEGVSNNACHS